MIIEEINLNKISGDDVLELYDELQEFLDFLNTELEEVKKK